MTTTEAKTIDTTKKAPGNDFLDADEELRLIALWQTKKDYAAREKVVLAHKRLVQKLTWAFRHHIAPPAIELCDLQNCGNLGLMTAIDKFDAAKECRFVTYAYHWVRSTIWDYICRNSSSVRFKATPEEDHAIRFLKANPQATDAELGALCARLGLTRTNIDILRYHSGGVQVVSANTPISYLDGDEEFIDQIVDEKVGEEATTEQHMECDRSKAVRLILDEATLKPQERRLLEMRWMRDDPATLSDVGVELGLTPERIRQIEKVAFSKLERASKRLKLDPVDLLGAA